MAPLDSDPAPRSSVTLGRTKGGAMTSSERRQVLRTAAELAMAIRSGDSDAVDRNQRELVRIERHQRTDR